MFFISFYSFMAIFAEVISKCIMGNGIFWGCVYWVYCIAALILMINIILKNRDSVKTLAWLLVLFFLPVIGVVLYFFFGRDKRKEKMIGNRLMSQINQCNLSSHLSRDIPSLPAEYSALQSFFSNTASAYALPADDVEVITDTARFAVALKQELEKAEKHIHIQFYIFEDDDFGRSVRDILMRKARQGVEVRFIYDSVGCWSVKREFYDEMRSAGVYVESFLKVRFPLFSKKVNYRNHRKVVVVDGITGLVGGCNVADRYLDGVSWGRWRDTMLLVRGMAVQGLQFSFLVDWYFANHSLVSGKGYFPQQHGYSGALLQVVPSNPVGEVRTLLCGFVKMLSTARSYAYLQTPYFMPDESFMMALKGAALSGVDVRLMIPKRSDSKITDYASMSYLGELLDVGVKVYLYEGGFLHSKSIVVDDSISSVGSANLDFRSFYYNFELSAIVYDKGVAQRLKECFMLDVRECRQLTSADYRARSFKQRCLESCVRLVSPLL